MRVRLAQLTVALWWGSLGTVAFLVVPLLFVHLPSPSVAGSMAARLFEAQTWVSVACGTLLLAVLRPKHASALEQRDYHAITLIVLGLLLALVMQFGVAPRIVARQDLKLWHTLGSAMLVGQWLCTLALLWHMQRGSAGK